MAMTVLEALIRPCAVGPMFFPKIAQTVDPVKEISTQILSELHFHDVRCLGDAPGIHVAMGREVQNMIQIVKFVPFQSSLVCSFSGLQGYQVFEDPPGNLIETFRTRCGLDASQENGEI